MSEEAWKTRSDKSCRQSSVISRQQRLRIWLQKCLKGTQDGERVETSIESIIRYIWIFYLILHDIGSLHSNCLFAPSLFITAFPWCLDAASFYILLLEAILLTYCCVFQLLLEMLSWFFIWNEQWGMYFLADGGERDRERRRRRVFIFTSSPEVQRGERERVRERWWKVRDDGFARNSAHLIAKNCCTDVPPPMQWRWRFVSFMIVAKACSPFSLNRLGFCAVWK